MVPRGVVPHNVSMIYLSAVPACCPLKFALWPLSWLIPWQPLWHLIYMLEKCFNSFLDCFHVSQHAAAAGWTVLSLLLCTALVIEVTRLGSLLFFVHKCRHKPCSPWRSIFSPSRYVRERWKQRVKEGQRGKARQTTSHNKNKSVCTLLCSWSISMTSDPRFESASCSNLSGAFWGDSMCCGRETERWRKYTEKCLTHSGPGLGFWTAWLCAVEPKRRGWAGEK